jgi:hypothetical protein
VIAEQAVNAERFRADGDDDLSSPHVRFALGVRGLPSTKLRNLVRGQDPVDAEAEASRQLDRLVRDCTVTVAMDPTTQLVLPRVGPQCAAAVGAPGAAVDSAALRDCLHQLAGCGSIAGGRILPLTPGDPNTAFELELYDLGADPLELDNVASDPSHATRIAAMAARIRELRPTWLDDSDRTEEDLNDE